MNTPQKTPQRQRCRSYSDDEIAPIQRHSPSLIGTEPQPVPPSSCNEDDRPSTTQYASPTQFDYSLFDDTLFCDPYVTNNTMTHSVSPTAVTTPDNTCHFAQHNKAFPAPACANLTHDLGYCGPASLGLIFHQLLHEQIITPTSHNHAYAAPLDTVLRIFQQLYPTLPTSLDALTYALSHFDAHQIQWVYSPVFRVLLLCILRRAAVTNSDAFFCDAQHTYFKEPPWHNNHATYIDDSTITQAIEHLKQRNLSAICRDSADLDVVAHFTSPLQQDDLFVISRFLNLKLDIQLSCDCTDDMQSIKAYLVSQYETRMLEQCQYFGNILDTFVTVRVFYSCLITPEQGISGHYDLIRDEALAQKILARLPTPVMLTRQAIQTAAHSAHQDPGNWLLTQPPGPSQLHTLHPYASATIISPQSNNWMPSVDPFDFNDPWCFDAHNHETIFSDFISTPLPGTVTTLPPSAPPSTSEGNLQTILAAEQPRQSSPPTTIPTTSDYSRHSVHSIDLLSVPADTKASTPNTQPNSHHTALPHASKSYQPPLSLFTIPEDEPVLNINSSTDQTTLGYLPPNLSRRESYKDLQAACTTP